MEKISATEARIRFGELIRRVAEKGEAIIVEKGGKPSVVVISIDEYTRLKESYKHKKWKDDLEKLRKIVAKIRMKRGDKPLTPPEDIIREIREERDAKFSDMR